MFRKIILIIIFSIFLIPDARAEVLIMKDGRKMKGKIIEDKYEYIVIQRGKTITKFYRHEIEEIISDKPKRDESISDKKRSLIHRLLEINGVKKTIRSKYNALMTQYSGETLENIKSFIDVDEMMEALVPIYAKYYTEAELVALIEFYVSDAGSKHLKLTPKIMEDAMEVMLEHFSSKITDNKDKLQKQ